MKKVLSFITVLTLVLGVSNVKALQNNYYVSDMYPYDDYELDNESGIVTLYNANSYQIQPMSKENYKKLLGLEEQYEKDYNELYDKRENAADEVASTCGFDKDEVLNWCATDGGFNCDNIEYDENTISSECKTAITNYESYRGNWAKGLYIEYENKIYELLPNIDDNKWSEVKDKKVSLSNDLSDYQVLYTKNLWSYEGESGTSYQFAIFYNESGKTNTEKVEEVKADANDKKEETKNEEVKTENKETNPKTGMSNYYGYLIGITVISFISYLSVRKVRKFSK